MNEQGGITYDVAEIPTDRDILQMIYCKSEFPINIIIELYVTFRRSNEGIFFSSKSNYPILFYKPKPHSNFTNNIGICR